MLEVNRQMEEHVPALIDQELAKLNARIQAELEAKDREGVVVPVRQLRKGVVQEMEERLTRFKQREETTEAMAGLPPRVEGRTNHGVFGNRRRFGGASFGEGGRRRN